MRADTKATNGQREEEYAKLAEENKKLKKKLSHFESKYKNIDLDILHSKNQML